MKFKLIKIVSVFLFGIMALAIGGCGSSSDDDSPAAPAIKEIRISHDGVGVPAVPAGTSVQYAAAAVYDNDEVKDITAVAAWSSSDDAVVTMGRGAAAGKAIAVSPGTATITVSYKDFNATTVLNVTSATLQSINVAPASASTVVGLSVKYEATGLYSDNSSFDLTDQVDWNSSNSAVANMNGNTAEAKSPGDATITASLNGMTSNAAKLAVAKAALTKVIITNGDVSVPAGTLGSFKATGEFNNGWVLDITEYVTWSSGNESIVTIDKLGNAQALKAGTAEVTAKYDTQSDTVTVTVTDATLQSIAVTPANASTVVDLSVEYKATGYYSDNTTADLTKQVAWKSSNDAVAKMNGSTAYAVGAGDTTVAASLNSVTSNAAKLAVAKATLTKVTITNGDVSVPAGTLGSFKATGEFDNNNSMDITQYVTWLSSDPAVVAIDRLGNAQALTAGDATITAKYDTQSDTVTVTVTDATLQSIAVTPANASTVVDLSVEYKATGYYSDNTTADLTKQVAWKSSNDAVAKMNGSTAYAVGAGDTTVAASLNSVTSNAAKLAVAKATLTKVTITNGDVSVPAGTLGSFKATGEFDNNNSMDITQYVTWLSSDPAVVAIDRLGNAQALTAGDATITAKYGAQSDTVNVHVSSAVLQEIVVNAGDPVLITGTSTTMTAIGKYSDGTDHDITKDADWTSDNTDAVKMDGNIARGVGVGEATVKATHDGVRGSLKVKVEQAQVTSLRIVKDDSSALGDSNEFIVGETVKTKALADFDNGVKNRDVTDKVTWVAGSEGTVSVEKGLITALKPGSATVSAHYKGEFGEASDTITGEVVAKTVKEVLIFSDPEDASVPAGHSIRLEAWALYNDGSNRNISDTVKWTSSDPKVVITQDKNEKYVTAVANENISATVEALHKSGKKASKTVTFEAKVADHIEIQEGYCSDGNCAVVTGKTIEIPIVDDVNYDPVSKGAYYPTAWLVYSDGSKAYINTQSGIRWWSADQVRAYVNTVKGSFVFGRGTGNGIEISVSYRGEHRTSFFVDVKEDQTTKTLREIGIVNTKDLGWGCSQDDAHYGHKLALEKGDSGKYLQACGKFQYSTGVFKWEDINNNVAWFSSDSDVARVWTSTGVLHAFSAGNTVISAQLAEIKGAIDVTVTESE